jgi:hypothetical protein
VLESQLSELGIIWNYDLVVLPYIGLLYIYCLYSMLLLRVISILNTIIVFSVFIQT